MYYPNLLILSLCLIKQAKSVRLNKLFQFIDGYRSEHNLVGFLHVGQQYSVMLKAPEPHALFLEYELYESMNIQEDTDYKPALLAVSKIPLEYLKRQLVIYRAELYKAKYVDEGIVPGTQVKSVREWQLDNAINGKGFVYKNKMPVLRTVVK